jgi:ubiquinone biosynthesis protein COQ4
MTTSIDAALPGSVQERVGYIPIGRRLWLGVKELVWISENPYDSNALQRFSLYINSGSYPALCRRFEAEPSGRRLMRERTYLDKSTLDLEALAKLPPGTLGHAYAHMFKQKQLELFGRPSRVQTKMEYLALRMAQTHDIQHVVLGYGTDTLGELELQAFLWAQQRLPGHLLASVLGGPYVSLQPWFGGVHQDPFAGALSRRRDVVRRFRDFQRRWMAAYRRGKAARFLMPFPWEAHWGTPLDTLREQLGLRP